MIAEFEKFKTSINQKAIKMIDVKCLLEKLNVKFQYMLMNAHVRSQREFLVHQLQFFITQKADALYRRDNKDPEIIEQLVLFLQQLELRYGGKFNAINPSPLFNYHQQQRQLAEKFQYIKQEIKKHIPDDELIHIIKRFLSLEDERKENQGPSWQKLEYLNKFCNELCRLLQNNKNSEEIPAVIFHFFIRYNFNKEEAYQYYLARIDSFFNDEEAAHKRWLNSLAESNRNIQNGIVYCRNRYSVGEEILKLHKSFKKYSDKKDSLPVLLRFNEDPKTFMVIHRIFYDIAFLGSKNNEQYFEYLSEIVRGPRGQQYKPKTLKNCFSPDIGNCFEDAERILMDAQNKLQEYVNEYYGKGLRK